MNEPVIDDFQLQFTYRGLALAGLVWLGYSLFYAAVVTVWGGVPLLPMLVHALLQSAIMASLSVPVWWWVVRGMAQQPKWRQLMAHLAMGPLFAALYGEIYLIVTDEASPFSASFLQYRAWYFVSHLSIYACQFAIYHHVADLLRHQAREHSLLKWKAMADQARLAALKSQINPHFLFNALNSISASIPATQESARKAIRQLADMLRYVLDEQSQDQVTLSQELDFVTHYLQLEQLRFGERLGYSIEVADRCQSILIPPMTLQPLVENAVRHGLGVSHEGLKVAVKVAELSDAYRVCVSDNGEGVAGQSLAELFQQGLGLRLTDQRLRRQLGGNSGLILGQAPGFEIAFLIPKAAW